MSELNLIPYELKLKRAKAISFKKYMAYGIIIICISIFIVLIPTAYLAFLNSQEVAINQKISNGSKLISEHKKLLSDLENYRMYNAKVELITNQKVNVTDKIKNLEKYKPKDIHCTNITVSKENININGSTSNYNSISIFTAKLQMSKEYINSRILNISSNDSNKLGKYQFTLVIPQ